MASRRPLPCLGDLGRQGRHLLLGHSSANLQGKDAVSSEAVAADDVEGGHGKVSLSKRMAEVCYGLNASHLKFSIWHRLSSRLIFLRLLFLLSKKKERHLANFPHIPNDFYYFFSCESCRLSPQSSSLVSFTSPPKASSLSSTKHKPISPSLRSHAPLCKVSLTLRFSKVSYKFPMSSSPRILISHPLKFSSFIPKDHFPRSIKSYTSLPPNSQSTLI